MSNQRLRLHSSEHLEQSECVGLGQRCSSIIGKEVISHVNVTALGGAHSTQS